MLMLQRLLWLFLLFSSELAFTQDNGGEISDREKYLRQFAKDASAVKSDKDFKPSQAEAAKKEGKWPGVGTVQVRDIPNSPSGTVTIDSDENEFDPELSDLEQSRKRMEALTQQLGQGDDNGDKLEQLKLLQKKLSANPLTALKSKSSQSNLSYSEMAKQVVAGMEQLSEADIILMLQGRFQTGLLANLIRKPNVSSFIATVLKDKEVLPALAGIAENKKMLMVYGSFILVTFFMSYLLKRLQNSFEVTSPLSGVKRFVLRHFIMTGVRFGAFFWLFQKNLSPLWKLAKQYFF